MGVLGFDLFIAEADLSDDYRASLANRIRHLAEACLSRLEDSDTAVKMSDHDPVNHPRHYTSSPAVCECGKTIECIQVTEHLGFCLGNAVKYIWRAGLKNDEIEDLKKSRWYLDREIQRRERHGRPVKHDSE